MYSKDMSKVYASKTTLELQKLRSKKVLQLLKLSGMNGYFVKRDRELLSHQVSQIDAELEARRSQLTLL